MLSDKKYCNMFYFDGGVTAPLEDAPVTDTPATEEVKEDATEEVKDSVGA